jgi:hypothetical protein
MTNKASKIIINITFVLMLIFTVYKAVYICKKDKIVCGTINLKYESSSRTSSSSYIVIGDYECKVSKKYYHSHNVGEYVCINDSFTQQADAIIFFALTILLLIILFLEIKFIIFKN